MATVAQIKADLTKKVGVAMNGVKKQVYDIFFNVIMQYYMEYDPRAYERTYQVAQLAENIATAGVKVRQVGASFEVYFDGSMLSYSTGTWSGGRVLDNVMIEGDHGRALPGGTTIWTESMNRLDTRINLIIKEELIKAGIPIH